jgi:thiosulfate/3-mercaptopyruvate sulfurtransferase
MGEYANPNSLVSCDWLEEHVGDDNVVVVEVDIDTKAYDEGHIPGAVAWGWDTHLSNQGRRDILGLNDFEKLLGSSGVGNNTTVVFYGDNNNWFATWAFWQLRIYGHQDTRILNGGRKKWIGEGRKLVKDAPKTKPATYKSTALNQELRALLPQVKAAVKGQAALIDVRTHDEFTGKRLAPPGLPETCQRGGHIPGARSIPWTLTCNEDGTFKSADELKTLYGDKGVTPDKEVIAYCRIGERSSHSWFVLKHLLGYPNVKNYDGSWTEWGNLVGVPIETGEERSEPARRE